MTVSTIDRDIALVSLVDIKTYLGITNILQDDLLQILINQASVIISKELATGVVAKEYTQEVHSGDGDLYLMLNNYPVIDVSRVAVGRDTAMTVEYSSGDASHATVQVTAKKVKLKKTVSGIVTTNDFPISDYATVDLLETAIDATTGWDADVASSFTGYPANDLIPIAAYYANEAKASLEIPQQNDVDVEIDNVGWSILYNPFGWDTGIRNIIVDYRAGYEREDIPEPLASACMELTSILFNMSQKDLSLKSESIGSYKYSVADRVGAMFSSTGVQNLSNTVAMKIAPYRRIVF